MSLEPTSPDAALVARCRGRDAEALRRVAEEYGPRIYRWRLSFQCVPVRPGKNCIGR